MRATQVIVQADRVSHSQTVRHQRAKSELGGPRMRGLCI